ncbi:hypothetical protein ARMSODRAFT_396105 [Armillaria solidipes]|uniref:Uncharacterized protein n=1 Tax=Armillaria solidipes TaxID=1076256 RepID=A0A2H3CHH6_9AGAR|nr:hypothetical protein ARMSODRAFT_396105 [Armillaria solidipes]
MQQSGTRWPASNSFSTSGARLASRKPLLLVNSFILDERMFADLLTDFDAPLVRYQICCQKSHANRLIASFMKKDLPGQDFPVTEEDFPCCAYAVKNVVPEMLETPFACKRLERAQGTGGSGVVGYGPGRLRLLMQDTDRKRMSYHLRGNKCIYRRPQIG